METPSKSPETNTFRFRRRFEGERDFEEVIDGDYHLMRFPLSRGKVTLINGRKTLYDGPALPGMMRLLSPGEQLRTIIHVPFDGLGLRIPGHVVRSAIAVAGKTHRRGDPLYVNPLLQPKFEVEQLARPLRYAEEFDPAHARLYVDGLVHSLLTCLLHYHAAGLPGPRQTKGLAAREWDAVVNFADASMEQALNLDCWAAVLSMPAPEFTRRFRINAGCSPYAWFMRRRIERAKELLLQPKLSLCDVAFMVGFSSQSHLTEAFRRRVGFPPARWRQLQCGTPKRELRGGMINYETFRAGR